MRFAHPLLARAHSYPRTEVNLIPTDCLYDPVVGAWCHRSTGQLWIETPNRVGPQTKKQDIETGEDQKGE